LHVYGLYKRREHAGAVEHVFYVPGEDGPAAEVHFNDETQDEKTLYLHKDALGSVRVVTDDKGTRSGCISIRSGRGSRRTGCLSG
jgi:hypothetical protein